MAVVGVAMNWRGVHVLNVLHGNGGEGHDVHLPVVGDRRRLDRFERRSELGVIVEGVVLNSRVNVNGLEAEQLPEAIRDFYRLAALGVARAATRLDGRGNLDAIQAVPVNRRNGRIVEEFAGWANLISGRDYGNAERHRIHAGCL